MSRMTREKTPSSEGGRKLFSDFAREKVHILSLEGGRKKRRKVELVQHRRKREKKKESRKTVIGKGKKVDSSPRHGPASSLPRSGRREKKRKKINSEQGEPNLPSIRMK